MLSKSKMTTKTLTMAAILTAIVFVLQFAAAGLARAGFFTISLVLVPIVIGAATCGKGVGAWLGFVFGVAVLFSGDANLFLAVDVFGTILTVLVKGTLCGLASALVYKAIEKTSGIAAVFAAAITSAVTNTGVFLLGCLIFFMDTVKTWAVGMGFGDNVGLYMIVGLVGVNFLIELGINLVLSPVIVRLIKLRERK